MAAARDYPSDEIVVHYPSDGVVVGSLCGVLVGRHGFRAEQYNWALNWDLVDCPDCRSARPS